MIFFKDIAQVEVETESVSKSSQLLLPSNKERVSKIITLLQTSLLLYDCKDSNYYIKGPLVLFFVNLIDIKMNPIFFVLKIPWLRIN